MVSNYQLLTSPDVYGTTLLVWFIDQFTTEALQWHPETIQMEVQDKAGVLLKADNFDKLMAAINILTTDQFFNDVSMFIPLANAICGSGFNPTVFDIADARECAWAVTEAKLINPLEEGESFSEDIRGYIEHVLLEEGFVKAPKSLEFAIVEGFYDKVTYSFSDDPAMFAAIQSNQIKKTDELDQLVVSNMTELFGQLEQLRIKNGSTQGLLDKLIKN